MIKVYKKDYEYHYSSEFGKRRGLSRVDDYKEDDTVLFAEDIFVLINDYGAVRMSSVQHLDWSKKPGWQFSEVPKDYTTKVEVELMTMTKAKVEYTQKHPEGPQGALGDVNYSKIKKSEIDVDVLEIQQKRVLLTTILTDPETSTVWNLLPWRK